MQEGRAWDREGGVLVPAGCDLLGLWEFPSGDPGTGQARFCAIFTRFSPRPCTNRHHFPLMWEIREENVRHLGAHEAEIAQCFAVELFISAS